MVGFIQSNPRWKWEVLLFLREKGTLFLGELTDTLEVQGVPQNTPYELQQTSSRPKTGLLPPLDTPSSPPPTGGINASLSLPSSVAFQTAIPIPLTPLLA